MFFYVNCVGLTHIQVCLSRFLCTSLPLFFVAGFLNWEKNNLCQIGSLCMFSRPRACAGQVWCLMCAPYCLQAVVSDEHDAKGRLTLNPRTSQHSLKCAYHNSPSFKRYTVKKSGARKGIRLLLGGNTQRANVVQTQCTPVSQKNTVVILL